MRTEFLPYHLPSIGQGEIDAVVDTLRSGWLTTGPKVKRFEAAFAAAVGVPHAIAVNSCTAGLHLGLEATGVGRDDEVIVPTFTFAATAEVVVLSRLGDQWPLTAADFDGMVRQLENDPDYVRLQAPADLVMFTKRR